MNVVSFSVSPLVVAVVLVVLPILYQLNARITPWTPFHVRMNGRYMQFWWSNTVLHWASTIVVLGLVFQSGSGFEAIGLSIPDEESIVQLVIVYSVFLGVYYWGVIAQDTLDERRLEQCHDGWTPATLRQRIVSVFTLSITPGFCEEIVYRGFAITALLSFGYSQWVAIIVATLPFILLHGTAPFSSVRLVGRYAALGVGFSVIYLQTGSLWPAIVAHASYNIVGTIYGARSYSEDETYVRQ